MKESAWGRFMLAEGSQHYLQMDAPDLVERSAIAVVHDLRAKF